MLEPGDLDLNEPHDLSLVLTGALYALLVAEYEEIREEDYQEKLATETSKRQAAGSPALTEKEKGDIHFSVSGFALFKASEKFKRIAFRALDYLPPGEISYADYGRAMVASDLYSNPDDPEPRDFIKREFERRGMVDQPSSLDPVAPGFDLPSDLDLEQLRDSDWAAYRFAEMWREKLMIPEKVPFNVRPRLDVSRTTWQKNGVKARNRALLFKVAWQEAQSVGVGELISEVAVTRGTTLAIDWNTKKVTTLLSTSPQHPSQADASTSINNAMRRAFLVTNIAEGTLELSAPEVQIQDKTLRVRATGQMLHMMGH
jgi:hypothetical protein